MANALYPLWKQELMKFTANNNLSTGTVKVALVDTASYTYNSTHQFYSSLAGVIGTPQTLASKTFVNGAFDAADITYTSVTPAGTTIEALVIYIDTGTTTTSPLVAYIDTGITGLPVTTNGGNITVTWNASGIFQL